MFRMHPIAVACALGASTHLLIADHASGGADALLGVTWDGRAVSIDPTTGAATDIGPTGFSRHNALARTPDGTLWSMQTPGGSPSPVPGVVLQVDPGTGGATEWGELATDLDVRDMAPSNTGLMYAVADGGAGDDELWMINTFTGDTSLIGATGRRTLQSLAMSRDGTLYTWSMAASPGLGEGLMTIDATTGVATDVNPGDLYAHRFQALTFSPDGRLLGVTASSGPGFDDLSWRLFEIDTATGTPTELGPLGSHVDVRGLAIAPAPAAPVAMLAGALCSCARRRRR